MTAPSRPLSFISITWLQLPLFFQMCQYVCFGYRVNAREQARKYQDMRKGLRRVWCCGHSKTRIHRQAAEAVTDVTVSCDNVGNYSGSTCHARLSFLLLHTLTPFSHTL